MVDYETLLSDAQDLTNLNGASVLSQKSYDAGVPGSVPQTGATVTHDLGRGGDVDVFVRVVKAFTSASSTGTLKVELIMADDEALTTNIVVLQTSAAIIVTSLILGFQKFGFGKLPVGSTSRFFGFRYTNATDTFTAGQLHAQIGIHKDNALTAP